MKKPPSQRIMFPMKNHNINRRRFLIAAGAALGSAAVLSACATGQPIASTLPQVGFSHLPPMLLNVARVDVTSAYKSPMQAPNAEHRLPEPPERAMLDWAGARLLARGDAGTQAVAAFVIEDAAVIETRLEKTKGLTGFLTYEPAERYDARAVASLTVKDPVTGSGGHVRVSAARSIEVRENATLAEREQAWVELVENLMADFNTQMQTQTQAHLSSWLQPS